MKIKRRNFLKGFIGSISALTLHGVQTVFPEYRAESTSMIYLPIISIGLMPLEDNEEYAGFLALPENASVPESVVPPALQPPITCGVGGNSENVTGRSVFFETISDLKAEVNFPLYGMENLPSDIVFASSSALVYDETQDIFSTIVRYEAPTGIDDINVSPISINARGDFAHPFPVWKSNPVAEGEPFVEIVKFDSLPSPGIRINSQDGYIFQWIENDTLYTVRQENSLLPTPFDYSSIIGTLVKYT